MFIITSISSQFTKGTAATLTNPCFKETVHPPPNHKYIHISLLPQVLFIHLVAQRCQASLKSNGTTWNAMSGAQSSNNNAVSIAMPEFMTWLLIALSDV